MRATFVVVSLFSLTSVVPAAAQEYPAFYARGDAGMAVEVPWVGLRLGKSVDRGSVGLDLGLSGSPAGRSVLSFTGGLEARARFGKRISPFGRVEVGGMSQSQGGLYGVVSVGGGLAVNMDRPWALRAGLMYSLHLGDSIHGPDFAFVGVEYRFSRP